MHRAWESHLLAYKLIRDTMQTIERLPHFRGKERALKDLAKTLERMGAA